MIWSWWAAPGLLVALATLALAVVVLRAAPQLEQNRFLASLIVAMALITGLRYGLRALPGDVGLWAGWAGWPVVILAYLAHLLFLSTIDSPLSRPLRNRAVRIFLVLAHCALLADFVLRTDAWVLRVEPREVIGGWFDVEGPMTLALNRYGIVVFLLSVAVAVWGYLRAGTRGNRRKAKWFVLGFAAFDLVLASWLGLFALGWPGFAPSAAAVGMWIGPPLANLLLVTFLGYGILTSQLWDIDLRLKWTVRQSTVATAFVAVFFFVSEVASELLAERLGVLMGVGTAALLVLVLTPLQRFAERVSDAAMPGVEESDEYLTVRKHDVYRALLEEMLADRSVSVKERRALFRLREDLDIDPAEALRLEAEVMDRGEPG